MPSDTLPAPTQRTSPPSMEVISGANMAIAPKELSAKDIETYNDRGFIVFKDVFSAQEVESIREGMAQLCLKAFDGLKDGSFLGNKSKGPSGRWSLSKKEGRFSVQFESAIDIHDVSREELTRSYRKLMSFAEETPTFEALDRHPFLSTYRRQLLGDNSILSQAMGLSKPARFGIEKPWHQDNAYFTIAPLEDVMGIWIAIDDATLDNGCMHFVPHQRYQGPAHKHIRVSDCEINKENLDLEKQIAVEVPAGGAIFFQGMAPHQTPPNFSDQGRRALQWHYRGANTKILSQDEYDQIFKTRDGHPASCVHT